MSKLHNTHTPTGWYVHGMPADTVERVGASFLEHDQMCLERGGCPLRAHVQMRRIDPIFEMMVATSVRLKLFQKMDIRHFSNNCF